MSISPRTRKMLWGRAANRCAFPECRSELIIDETEVDEAFLLGMECHIAADSSDGPRGDDALRLEERDTYPNLIILCPNHHRTVDAQRHAYTVERLREMKQAHEQWVRDSLPGYDQAKQRDDEIYSEIVEDWSRRCDLDNWNTWTSPLLSHGQPSIRNSRFEDMKDLRRWLLSRVWPNRYQQLEDSFLNFRMVLNDLCQLFSEYAEEIGPDNSMLTTHKTYHDVLDPEESDRVWRIWEFHVALVQDLTVELTRAGNFVCQRVRESVSPRFRIDEGQLLFTYGPNMYLDFQTVLVTYGNEAPNIPYPGIEEFKRVRETRDFFFARGTSAEDPDFEP